MCVCVRGIIKWLTHALNSTQLNTRHYQRTSAWIVSASGGQQLYLYLSQLNSISSRTWLNRLISNLNTFTPPICLEMGAYWGCIAAPANRTDNCRHVYCLWQSAIQVATPTVGTCPTPTPTPHSYFFTFFSSFSLYTICWHCINFSALSPCKHFQVIQLFVGLNSDFAWVYSI